MTQNTFDDAGDQQDNTERHEEGAKPRRLDDAAEAVIRANQARPRPNQCHGKLRRDSSGCCYLEDCGRWPCWLHGQARLERERQSIMAGCEELEAATGVRVLFHTLQEADPHRSHTDEAARLDFHCRCRTWFKRVRLRTSRELGCPLEYVCAADFNSAEAVQPGQSHRHGVMLAPPERGAPPDDPHRRFRQIAVEEAAKLDLQVWIKERRSIERAAQYITRHLLEIDGFFPSRKHRISRSEGFKLAAKKRLKA
jgi:hypothetical protein